MRCIAQPRWLTRGPLRVVELPAPAGSPTVVCMHGYGANAQDLLPIGLGMDLERPVRWVFPEAPLPLDNGPQSRAWFPLDEARINELQMRGENLDVSQERPEGLDGAVRAAQEMLAGLDQPLSQIVLGGFSQGSMIAVELAARAEQTPLGLFILSGTLIDEHGLTTLAPKIRGLKFFQSHGSADPILSFQIALRLRQTLEQSGLEGDFLRFEGGHSVPPEAAQGLRNYLNLRFRTA